jgi:hypothetical protein
MSLLKKISLGALGLFISMQLYRPELEKKSVKDSSSFEEIYNVPVNIKTMLKNSCNDCHSNTTNFPWYAQVQPFRFLIYNHIIEGRSNLNFSEFGEYSERKKANKIKSMVSQIKSNEMPIGSYELMHGNAHINADQKDSLLNWLKQLNQSLQ